jgi:hypothetical protein
MRRALAASATLALAALLVAPAGCGRMPRKATKADCERWGDQFATLAKKAYADVGARCWTGGGMKIAQSQADPNKKLVLSADLDYARKIDAERDSLVTQCGSQDGAKYYPPDAECFLRAGAMHDWLGCRFQTPFFTSMQDVVVGFEKQVADVCGG